MFSNLGSNWTRVTYILIETEKLYTSNLQTVTQLFAPWCVKVLSNGRYKSAQHRAVTNKDEPRVSIAMFHGPDEDTIIGPIEELIDEKHPPLFRSYRYRDFIDEFNRQEGNRRSVKEVFELHH